MKVLVTGATGLLGHAVCQELKYRNMNYIGISSKELNITDAVAVVSKFKEYQPDVVIHCAAYTKVDESESQKGHAYAVNAKGTQFIAEACYVLNARMLYISTDYVFGGTGKHFNKTNDSTEPINIYGASKLAGEIAIKQSMRNYYILRTSWLFGENRENFVSAMLLCSKKQDIVPVVDDQIGSPTYTVDLARLICDMMVSDKFGLYHATNQGICSRADFAREIFRQANKNITVKNVATADYPSLAKRPLNSRLDQSSICQAGFKPLPIWQDALWRYLHKSI